MMAAERQFSFVILVLASIFKVNNLNFANIFSVTLEGELQVPTLEDAFQLWHSFAKLNTNSQCKLLLPLSAKLPLVTKRYMGWWTPKWSKIYPLGMKIIIKYHINDSVVSRKEKEKKNDLSLTKKKRISHTHKKDKQVVDVDLGKDDGAQTCAHIKKTPLMIPSAKGVSSSEDPLKKDTLTLAQEGSAQSFSP
ncbi:hypothetical protein POTOM_061878 [Populus tomentosa]|uniref:Uncharacterized protein n=1 Tax=Populus tomentosa TaxID=118781 RepID=A0A8X7XP34_POPTO|nr:hypothetical protein POTOM_061878 [Populus tomentosa]